jgi:Lon protease-like protein
MQALHIYETRYRAMLEEAIEDDRLIALGVLAPGWEQNYEGRPTLRSTACLCRVATHQRTPEGTYNVLLLGVRRLRLVRELPPKKLFRVVESEIMDDIIPDDEPPDAATHLQQELLSAFKRAMPKIPDAYEQLDQLLGSQITLGMLSDIVAYTIDLDIEWKMRLLAECNVFRRTQLLLEAIAQRPAAGMARPFPPQFSVN